MALLALALASKKDSMQTNSEPAEITRYGRRSTLFERIELASAIFVVFAILTEDWDILPMVIHPTTKDGIKAIGGVAVATFIALEILFSQLAKKHDGIVRGWQARRIAELNLRAEQELTARAQLIGILKDADEQIADLKERTAWREITSNHVEQFQNKLSVFAGQHVYIVVDANAPGGEPKNFGSHIEFALGAANWDAVSRNCKPGVTISMVTGIYALASQDGHCGEAAKALNELFHSMDFSEGMDERSRFTGPPYWPEEIWNSGSAPKVLIVVKEKPRPPTL
jgi:hypothetical protein